MPVIKEPYNIDQKVVEDFGVEWATFDQSEVPYQELKKSFNFYFRVFPMESFSENSTGFDLGCGSGRWAQFVAPMCKHLHCIDPSAQALDVARRNLSGQKNCSFHLAGVQNILLDDSSMDFGYSLGVLHHVPDTGAAIKSCVAKLKSGAPLLLYLYYAFDNKPLWFKTVWKSSDQFRRLISKSPHAVKYALSQLIAVTVYWPLSRFSALMEKMGKNVENIPLSAYRDKSFYTLRTDALDRFGTRLEKRFTRDEIRDMMEKAGLENIRFSDEAPYWCAVGFKK